MSLIWINESENISRGFPDPPKLNRSTELLSMQKELTQARKVLTVDDEASLQ
ncbi:hypothetical protein LINPERHAP2_LOCUS32252 [Linum perenne]